LSNYRDQLESYLKTLDIKADRVLDVGGAALPVKDRVRTWDVNEYLILDTDSNDPPVIDFQLELDDAEYYKETADVVFCLEVMEYIIHPIVAVRNLHKILKPNGILYITMQGIYPTHNPIEDDAMRWTKNGAIKILSGCFDILQIIPRTMTPAGESHWIQFMKAEGMHPAKGMKHNELGWIIKARKC
jgi:SAM-dependent methyltransferase